MNKRFSGEVRMPYNYEIISLIEGDGRTICELEHRLQKENKKYRYTPILNFGGMCECFSQINS